MGLDRLVERLRGMGRLEEAEAMGLCAMARDTLAAEPNVISVRTPVAVCGNVTGHFHSLMRVFATEGWCPDTNYLFLGGYVNQGKHSLATLLLLLALKVRYPDRIALLRGNHEARMMTRVYGFYDECKREYSLRLWREACTVFDLLPLSAVVDDRVFAVHAGPPVPSLSLDLVRLLDRTERAEHDNAPVFPLLWGDPDESVRVWDIVGRGQGEIVFGPDGLRGFLHANALDLAVRSHQVVDGFEWMFGAPW